MTPDIENAAIKAYETLIKYKIKAAPIIPLPILRSMPNVFVASFAEIANDTGLNREGLVTAFGAESQDAVTYASQVNGKTRYFIAYNQRFPFFLVQRGLARELGHIVLGHDGTRPEAVRMEEAQMFAYHFLCPRPLIYAIQQSPVPMTVEVLGTVTGCYEHCLSRIRKAPGVHVPAELNRLVRDNFEDYLNNYIDYKTFFDFEDEYNNPCDFGTYMDGYEE